ncbi:MAG: M50 family metallopeptidase [Burkholderiales bacterium]|nr:M50 family metallopeptidase [Burkholderiales bacterium]
MAKTELHVGRFALLVGLCALGVWGWDWAVLTPFKLLAVLGHETGHAAASWLVGGSVQQVTVRPGESGECLSFIPDSFFARVLLSSGGYVGAAVIAVVLLFATFRLGLTRAMLGLACAWLLFMGLFFGRDLFTVGFSVGMAALFAAGAKWLPEAIVGSLNLFIASFQVVYSAYDLKSDLWNSAVRERSDAAILAANTGVPAILWAGLWTVISLAVLGVGVYFALKAPAGRAAQNRALVTD